jgi:hypothetical protein
VDTWSDGSGPDGSPEPEWFGRASSDENWGELPTDRVHVGIFLSVSGNTSHPEIGLPAIASGLSRFSHVSQFPWVNQVLRRREATTRLIWQGRERNPERQRAASRPLVPTHVACPADQSSEIGQLVTRVTNYLTWKRGRVVPPLLSGLQRSFQHGANLEHAGSGTKSDTGT